jgi:hypothetical protein
MTQNKRIMGMVIFDNMNDAERAMDALEDAGFEFKIRHDMEDGYATVFMEAWRHVASDVDDDAATSTVMRELCNIVDPLVGLADEVAVFAEGEPHDYGTWTFRVMH